MDEDHGVEVGEVEDVALALVDGDEEGGGQLRGVEETGQVAAPGVQIVRVLRGELDAEGHAWWSNGIQVAEDERDDA